MAWPPCRHDRHEQRLQPTRPQDRDNKQAKTHPPARHSAQCGALNKTFLHRLTLCHPVLRVGREALKLCNTDARPRVIHRCCNLAGPGEQRLRGTTATLCCMEAVKGDAILLEAQHLTRLIPSSSDPDGIPGL